MKKSSLIFSSLLSLAFITPAFAEDPQMPLMRKYKESETGLAYTFSRVNLGGLNQMPVFITQQETPNTVLCDNLDLNSAVEFNYNYLQTLDSTENKVFFDLNYVHADGYTKSALNQNTPSHLYINQMFFHDSLLRTPAFSATLPYFANLKTHFDLGSLQTGISHRFYRAKHIDFNVLGGVDAAYFTTNLSINYLTSINLIRIAYSSKVTNNDAQKNGNAYDIFANPNQAGDYSSQFKTRFYGMGPYVGAKIQVPFNRDFLRVNIKLAASALMGYGTNYLNYNVENITSQEATPVFDSVDSVQSQQKHVFRLVPTLRGELSLDVIIKNFMFTGGLQQAVYFQALDINALIDLSEWNTGEFAYTTRPRLGQLVTGGPFVKLSYLF